MANERIGRITRYGVAAAPQKDVVSKVQQHPVGILARLPHRGEVYVSTQVCSITQYLILG